MFWIENKYGHRLAKVGSFKVAKDTVDRLALSEKGPFHVIEEHTIYTTQTIDEAIARPSSGDRGFIPYRQEADRIAPDLTLSQMKAEVIRLLSMSPDLSACDETPDRNILTVYAGNRTYLLSVIPMINT